MRYRCKWTLAVGSCLLLLLFLLQYIFPNCRDLFDSQWTAFDALLSDGEAAILRHLVRRFVDAAEHANVTYFMYWGTLLGSYRHHGRIPWDDEIDFMVSAAQKSRLHQAMMRLSPVYVTDTSADFRWKLYAENSTFQTRKQWKFPFVDVSFYNENQTTIWDEDPRFTHYNTFLKSDVFPFCRRPFDGLWLPAPRNTLAVVKMNTDECQSRKYDHRTEHFIPSRRVVGIRCSALWDRWPFVFRTEANRGTNETLIIGSQILSWAFVTLC